MKALSAPQPTRRGGRGRAYRPRGSHPTPPQPEASSYSSGGGGYYDYQPYQEAGSYGGGNQGMYYAQYQQKYAAASYSSRADQGAQNYYYDDPTQNSTRYEKLHYGQRAAKYKDYSHDRATISFYYEDFFKQFPSLNERTKEIVKGICECTQECLVCQNKIYQKSKIWSCSRCAQPYHLGCIRRWIAQVNFGEQYDKESGKSSLRRLKEGEVHWSCPNCTAQFSGLCPTYRCFCGKVDCPAFSPYVLPHSCGKPCDKKRHPWCSHLTCNTLCHPGQCDPCSEQIELTCFCGKDTRTLPCSSANSKYSCGKVCDRLLNCGKHHCTQICHEKLECNPCAVKLQAKCYCGKVEKEVLCGHECFSCEAICGRTLACGAHKCMKICHAGPCPECALLPVKVTTCPCGRMQLELLAEKAREKCTDPIAICGMPCEKLLPCGKHKCKSTCHMGPCPPCKVQVDQWCRCGSTERKVDCYLVQYPAEVIIAMGVPKSETEFLCKRRCDCLKTCNRHRCGRLCCDVVKKYGNHIHEDPSGYHICQLVCGKLLSCKKHHCPDFCHLGYCKPCPVISSQPLFCACGKARKDPPISCSEEPPYCPEPCPKVLPCGHKCGSKCHYGPCPSCMVLVPFKMCKCGKEQIAHVACSATNLDCGRRCNKPLPCGHMCARTCHLGKCLDEVAKEGEVHSCGQKCNKKHSFCIHTCQEICHPGKECPQEACQALITVYCPCRRRKEVIKCGVTTFPQERGILCNEDCARMQRKLGMDKFAGVKSGEETPSNPDYYPDKMEQLAKMDPALVCKVENMIIEMIHDRNQCGVPLPDIGDARKRELIVEMIQNNYYLDVGAYKTAKGISHDVYLTKNARIPKMLLSQVDKLRKDGTIKVDSKEDMPFEASIYVYNVQKGQNINDLKSLLGKYIYKYYVEKRGQFGYYLHFYDRKHAEGALEVLSAGAHSFKNFKLVSNEQLETTEEKADAEAEAEAKREAAEPKTDDNGFQYAE